MQSHSYVSPDDVAGFDLPLPCKLCGKERKAPIHVIVPFVAEPTKQRPEDQPLPVVNDSPFVQDAVKEYIEARKQIGIQRYGTPLQANNGRDALRDAFEESIDLSMYLAQMLIERDGHL